MIQQPSTAAQATVPLGTQPKLQVTDQFANPVAGLTIIATTLDCTLTVCGRVTAPLSGQPSLNRSNAATGRRGAPPLAASRRVSATGLSTQLSIPTTVARTRSISDNFPRGLGGTTQVATDANGIAAFSNLSLNLTIGSWQLQFLDADKSLAPAISNDIVLSPGPAQSIIAWPAGADTTLIRLAGDTLAPAVKVIDKVGNGIPGVTVSWTPFDNKSLLPDATTTQTDANGIATPGRWVTLPVVPGPFRIQASPNLPNIENNPLTLWAITPGV